MSTVTRDRVEAALKGWTEPHLGTDLVSAGALRAVEGGRIELELGFPLGSYRDELAATVRELLSKAGIDAEVRVTSAILSHAVQRNLTPLKGVKNVIAVASGKGGVGKSTVAVNLALALAADGAAVGMLDADIYGPSQPRMLGLSGRPTSRDGKHIEPLIGHGVRCMSIGFLIDAEQPMVWRGPMVTQALVQLIRDTLWGELDYLIVDMPPGTGDIQLTLSQHVPVSGAVIVTTPQEIALLDARKGLKMFQKVEVSILGVVENMSTHVCTNCGHEEHIFGSGGGESLAAQYQVPFLGSLPLDLSIREQADAGNPTVAAEPRGTIATRYREIARRTAAQLALAGKDYAGAFPKIVIED
ncbi:MAG TPA: iron-sulfur cluster carrier protein ApbC [Gammaproteobacteria bacterium]|jgi:ATP-binding protein involved in chromosome partitioning|nr:iron-sulfur cluster carrier protein ApbC [Gammaproteobacteria bacterium]